jgi:hypothetical protein
MRRALIVSYYFPPRFSIGGKRAHRFAKYLPSHGWETSVLTAKGTDKERLDPTFSDADLPHCRVYRDYLSPSDLAKIVKQSMVTHGAQETPLTNAAPLPTKGWARVRFEARYMPVIGADQGLIPAFVQRIVRRARESRAELIFATGAPWESVVAATIAAKILRLPLVVEFRDPWSFGPIAARWPTWTRAGAKLVERAVLRSAQALVVTTETTREAYAQLGACPRLVCIRSGFDPSVPIEPKRSDAVTFIHFGNCYGERSLGPFIQALALVARRRNLGPSAVRLLNLGRVTRNDLELADKLGIASLFEHKSAMPYAEGMGVVAGADIALLPNFGAEPWFLPGKLYDYLQAGAPILAIDASPELSQILERSRVGWAHAPEDVEGLARRLEEAIDARAEGRTLVHPDAEAIAAMGAPQAAAKLAALFDEVISGGPHT